MKSSLTALQRLGGEIVDGRCGTSIIMGSHSQLELKEKRTNKRMSGVE